MAENGNKMKKLSGGLLVLLPLAGYAALQAGRQGFALGAAAAFALSMVVLIWLG